MFFYILYGVVGTTFNNGSLGFRIDEERSERAKRNVNCRIQ
jgi:phosphatidylserine/phosphatidylglycerophosphate/cardiolipin synthase-like enzyme